MSRLKGLTFDHSRSVHDHERLLLPWIGLYRLGMRRYWPPDKSRPRLDRSILQIRFQSRVLDFIWNHALLRTCGSGFQLTFRPNQIGGDLLRPPKAKPTTSALAIAREKRSLVTSGCDVRRLRRRTRLGTRPRRTVWPLRTHSGVRDGKDCGDGTSNRNAHR